MDLRPVLPGLWLASMGFLIPSAFADTYSIILHGKVEMEDGSPPPVTVLLERVCSDQYGDMPGVQTNKKGEYIWRMDIDPLESRNCVLRVNHTGFTSTVVEISGVDTIHTTLDLPPIKLRPAVADPDTLNFSDKNIPGRARKDWVAASKAVDNQNLQEVAQHLQAVTEAAPKAAQAWQDLGIVDEKLQATADARTAYEHAIAIDSKLLPAYLTLARVCITMKDWNCAAKSADTLISMDSKNSYPEIYLHQAVARYELKDVQGAEESVEKAIRLAPKDTLPRAQYVLGRILEAKGDVKGATQHMEEYLQLQPGAPDIDVIRGHINGLKNPQAPGADPDLEILN
jgi:cytochrome c-type biogenesis protein CcmH/NrfG